MEHIRYFGWKHPKLSATAAMGTILAVSALVGVTAGWAVDALAHLTNRKNDRVGEVVGGIVGVGMALINTLSFFSVPRRLDRHFGAGAWRHDGKTPEAAGRRILERNSAPVFKALEESETSDRALAIEDVKVRDRHVESAIKYITRKNIPAEEWLVGRGQGGYLVDRGVEGKLLFGNASFRATHDVRESGIKRGHVYESVYSGTRDLLNKDLKRPGFQTLDPQLNRFIAAAKRLNADGKVEKVFEPQMLEKLKSDLGYEEASAHNPTGIGFEAKSLLNPNNRDAPRSEQIEVLKTLSSVADAEDLRKNSAQYKKIVAQVMPEASKEAIAKNGEIYDERSFSRIDELSKALPCFDGLRPATFYSLLTGTGDALSGFLGNAGSVSNQGRSLGNIALTYLPLTLIASVVGVLCLGMSSTSTGSARSAAIPEGSKPSTMPESVKPKSDSSQSIAV